MRSGPRRECTRKAARIVSGVRTRAYQARRQFTVEDYWPVLHQLRNSVSYHPHVMVQVEPTGLRVTLEYFTSILILSESCTDCEGKVDIRH